MKNEIDSTLRKGVISLVTLPTEWCSDIVPVPKPNGRVRICLDLTPLNKAVQQYVLGFRFTLETDYKPLVPLLTTTDLSKMPPRVLRLCFRMLSYNQEVFYVPGKCQISRAPVSSPNTSDIQFIEEDEAMVSSRMDQLPPFAQRLQEIIEVQRNDGVCMQFRGYCQGGWPGFSNPYSCHIGKAELR